MARRILFKPGANNSTVRSGYTSLYFDENGILSQKEVDNKTFIQASLPYTTYVALLSQTGTSAPTSTIVDNTLSGTPSLARTGTGSYTLTLASEFPAGTTNCIIGSVNLDYTTSYSANIYRLSDDVIQITTGNWSTPEAADDVLNNTSIQIIIY